MTPIPRLKFNFIFISDCSNMAEVKQRHNKDTDRKEFLLYLDKC